MILLDRDYILYIFYSVDDLFYIFCAVDVYGATLLWVAYFIYFMTLLGLGVHCAVILLSIIYIIHVMLMMIYIICAVTLLTLSSLNLPLSSSSSTSRELLSQFSTCSG